MTPEQLASRILAASHSGCSPMWIFYRQTIEAAQGIIDELSTNALQLPNSNGDLENEY